MIMVRHFQEEEALPALPDLPKAVKVFFCVFSPPKLLKFREIKGVKFLSENTAV